MCWGDGLSDRHNVSSNLITLSITMWEAGHKCEECQLVETESDALSPWFCRMGSCELSPSAEGVLNGFLIKNARVLD